MFSLFILSYSQRIHVWCFHFTCRASSQGEMIVPPTGSMSTKLCINIYIVAPTKLIYVHIITDLVRAGSSIVWHNLQNAACAC